MFVSGAYEDFIADMLLVCPNLETLEIDSVVRLAALAPLPKSVHTVTLRPSLMTPREGYIEGLVAALMAGLFASKTGEIILEWGPVGKSSWKFLKKIAERRGVQLVHRLVPCAT